MKAFNMSMGLSQESQYLLNLVGFFFFFFLLQPTSSKWCFYSQLQYIVIAKMTNNAEDFPSSELSLQEQTCELT